jgi:hypothetical protein
MPFATDPMLLVLPHKIINNIQVIVIKCIKQLSLISKITRIYVYVLGARGIAVVKALYYKPEGRGFDSRLGEFLNLPNPSGRTMPWGLLSL